MNRPALTRRIVLIVLEQMTKHCLKKGTAKIAREARHFVDEGVFGQFCVICCGAVIWRRTKRKNGKGLFSTLQPARLSALFFAVLYFTKLVANLINCQNATKRPAKMGREAPHCVDEAFLLHFGS